MLRICVVLILVALCSTAPTSNDFSLRTLVVGPNQRTQGQVDDSEVVDNSGAGYSYFKKQQVEVRGSGQTPSPLGSLDMAEYMKSSALKQKKASFPSFSSVVAPVPQPLPVPGSISNQPTDLSALLALQQRTPYGQISAQDVQTWSAPQSILIPQTNINTQKTLPISAMNQRSFSNIRSNQMNVGAALLQNQPLLEPTLAVQRPEQLTMSNPQIQSVPLNRRVAGW